MRISSAITILGVLREKQNCIYTKNKIQNFGLGPTSVTRTGGTLAPNWGTFAPSPYLIIKPGSQVTFTTAFGEPFSRTSKSCT